MRVTVFSCGPAANESELRAFGHLKNYLTSAPGTGEWVLLTNLAFSVTHQLQSDEIDIIAIGPPGVRVIEVKHWTAQWVESRTDLVAREADKITNKARKIGTTLRRILPTLSRVDGAMLLTPDPSKVRRISGHEVRGVRFHSLNEWKDAVGFDNPQVLTTQQVNRLASELEPKSQVAIDGSLRRLAGYLNLELQTSSDERFHRIYKGIHSQRQDRVVLHLYDLSAINEKNAETKARREFEVLRRLQLHSWAPRILDSFQDAPGYSGEMHFFTTVDPAAPNIEARATDMSWKESARVGFARSAVHALDQFHSVVIDEAPLVHRNVTPNTILVKHDNSPILSGFERAKVPADISVASIGIPSGQWSATVAPEVREQGLAVADKRSDTYSLCASLKILFTAEGEELSPQVIEIIDQGLTDEPNARATLQEIETQLSNLLGESLPLSASPPARFWTEEQVVRFRDRDYRIVARLGSGGIGITFKVVEVDRSTAEEMGTYVGKVAHNTEAGNQVLKGYSLARSHLGRHPGLSAIFEVAREWHENNFIALMTWIEGAPLGEFTGVFPLLAEEQQEASVEALGLRWLRTMCEALDVLHRNYLVHGDISPRNMIVSGSDLVLTDYDFVTRIGEAFTSPGTVLYSSTSHQNKVPASPSDDIYALAASFFHVVFEREPFLHGSIRSKEKGLNWDGIDRTVFPVLASFLDTATSHNPEKRFGSVREALNSLKGLPSTPTHIEPVSSGEPGQMELGEHEIPWLLSVLQSYPGSGWGNRETRGLDTDFATETYVATEIEETLYRDILQKRVRLVVLCGNAGDGKTALLQHLAARLGLGKHPSSERILEGKIEGGLTIRMNLDGSAAWRGRSADELLDEFLEPFHDGPPTDNIVHLLAINDGRLLEWLEGVQSRTRRGETELTQELYDLVDEEAATQESFIRFINLNRRSLVGGVKPKEQTIQTGFLERLLDHLYGGEQATTIWAPCRSCAAKDRCEVFRATRVFAPNGSTDSLNQQMRSHARQRLFQALQAVHLRGETHITVRELRAALVYVLFGNHFCQDYHDDTNLAPLPYWDRTFDATSPRRQGEVLRELARFDPALEAHPQVDRYLISKSTVGSPSSAPHYDQLTLDSARRRAYFEWTDDFNQEVAGDRNAIDLARGRHLRLFRNLPIYTEEERRNLCARVCGGISRLEDLPPQALDRPGIVPLRVTPRTPTETAFWVEKPLTSFRLEADLPRETEGVERLHREAFLVYRYHNHGEERLRLGAELFHLLLELSDGYQLGDVSTDDAFAHLSIFVQRLLRENEHEMLALNPMEDNTIYRVAAKVQPGPEGPQQSMLLSRLSEGEQS